MNGSVRSKMIECSELVPECELDQSPELFWLIGSLRLTGADDVVIEAKGQESLAGSGEDDVSNISRQQDGSAAVTSAESVDGSAMMTSAVMSSQSAVSYSTTSRWYLKLAIAKRCHCSTAVRSAVVFSLSQHFAQQLFLCRLDMQSTVAFEWINLATAGCPVVGREMLATGFPNDCARAKRCRINLCKRHCFAIANSKYQLLVAMRLDTSSSTTSLHLLRLFTTADRFSSTADHCSFLLNGDAVTADVIYA
ncbi:hypothetical protein F511_24544 [Dorcoceras hygrometricum]|uniref:Uncharacterized protein n=1 Tax=Dorcoceras hygrometricum TaxID=472368 RepID=A0A2Z7DIH9_9LAMI|nr:hypothetical protein F511_24544 [Dorcoceras hygrometricum]